MALAPLAKRIGEIDGEFLKVVIQPWLAEKLRIATRSLVIVDNANGKFSLAKQPSMSESAWCGTCRPEHHVFQRIACLPLRARDPVSALTRVASIERVAAFARDKGWKRVRR